MARQRNPPSTSAPSDPSRAVPTSLSPAVSTPTSASTSTSAAVASPCADARIKQRIPRYRGSGRAAQLDEETEEMQSEDIPMAEHPLVDGGSPDTIPVKSHAGSRSKWIVLAIASGACAAFNGVFAKLATGELTSSISEGVAHSLHLSAAQAYIEVVVRCMFFGLNLAFNGVMWTLFTKALARGHSTTQVSIMNTSSNFVLTAVLGSAVFSEALPPLWWLGASLLVAGNVIIGQKDESGGAGGPQTAAADGFRDDAGATGESPAAEDRFGAYRDAELTDRMLAAQLGRDDDEDVPDLGEAEH